MTTSVGLSYDPLNGVISLTKPAFFSARKCIVDTDVVNYATRSRQNVIICVVIRFFYDMMLSIAQQRGHMINKIIQT